MRASLLLDGGLKYEESTGRYILYGRATGIVENKTVTAKLYRQRGDSWTFIDSVTNTDTAETVKAQKYVTVVENNRYRVDVTIRYNKFRKLKSRKKETWFAELW